MAATAALTVATTATPSEYAVRIRGLGKRFLRKEGSASLMRKVLHRSSEGDFFWALKDVTVDIRRGESFGFVGHNGAGKSTLLKIVSRIFMPTEGEVELYGSVNSLLEVGTGFEGDLTGRENVFLNGSILGMSKKEVASIYDEVVAFAGLTDFMDMPVKHYSSGMYARLAFSVAAYVTGDILAVDEVLSVGDAEFRRKSMKRMEDLMTGGGRTIIFVSHSTEAIARFCERAAWLHKGQVKMIGPADEVVREYLSSSQEKRSISFSGTTKEKAATTTDLAQPAAAPAAVSYAEVRSQDLDPQESFARIRNVVLTNATNANRDVVFRDEELTLDFTFEVTKPGAPPICGYISIACEPRPGVAIAATAFASYSESRRLGLGVYAASVRIPSNLLASATYRVLVGLRTVGQPMIAHDTLKGAVQFRVIDRTTEVGAEIIRGVVHPDLAWEMGLALEESAAGPSSRTTS